MAEEEVLTHDKLVAWWSRKYPREQLGEDGEPTWYGNKMLREIKQFTVKDVQEAMEPVLPEHFDY